MCHKLKRTKAANAARRAARHAIEDRQNRPTLDPLFPVELLTAETLGAVAPFADELSPDDELRLAAALENEGA